MLRFPGQVVQRFSQFCEVLDKGPIIGHESTESPDFRNISGHRPRGYGGDLVGVTLYACLTDNVSQKLNLPLEEVTFSRFEFQCISLQAIEYGR